MSNDTHQINTVTAINWAIDDAMARALLADAGSQLAGLTAKVINRLMAKSPHAPIAMTGSVFRQSTEVRQVFYNCLHARFPGLQVRNELGEPVEGALIRARRAGQTEKAVNR